MASINRKTYTTPILIARAIPNLSLLLSDWRIPNSMPQGNSARMTSAEPDQPGNIRQVLGSLEIVMGRDKLTSRPLKQGHDLVWVDAPAVEAAIPYLGERLTLNPHKQHGGPHNGVHGNDDEPDYGFHPTHAQSEQGQGKRSLAPGSCKDREKASEDGDKGHFGEVFGPHVVQVFAVVKANANRSGRGRDN